MSDVLVVASVLSLVFAVVMAVIAAKLLRENRARSVARVQALQELVAESAADDDAGAHADEDWDGALGQVRRSEFGVRSAAYMQSEVRTSNSELSLFAAPPHLTPSRRWIWIPATGLVIALGIGAVYTIFSGVFENASAATDATPTAPPAGPAAPIELLSLRHSVEADAPGTFVVTGLVQNPTASAAIRGVHAVVYLFDEEGRYFASSKAALDVTMLSPGGEAAFTVRVTPSLSLSAADVRRYRVSFQQQDGAAVSHVDRRGTLPEGTTGSAVEPDTPQAATTAKPAKPSINARKSG